MSHQADTYLTDRLNQRKHDSSYRMLKSENVDLVDFASNDYLGFAHSPILKRNIADELTKHPEYLNGSTGSRLLTGNTRYAQDLELQLALYHGFEGGLLFNSGYDANVGLFSSLPQRGDTVITDELIHASIIDGIRLSNANRYTFKHNNLEALEEKLKHAKGLIYVVIESVYSMDGDIAPIADILGLTGQYNAHLIVDEAHAIGVFDKGLVDQLRLQNRVFAQIITFGKAMGTHGAIVLGSRILCDYLTNFARSFIYSTAASFHQLAGIKMAYKLLDASQSKIDQLQDNIKLFKNLLSGYHIETNSFSAIHCIIIGNNDTTKNASQVLQDKGIDVRAVLSPTVAIGTERLRICLHAYNTAQQMELLALTLNNIING
ncbi:aminotransferase class I/II-fold pyridoxal phosphate-dependent enzyme [Mucilaginibacter agri]|uniref:Aminotransferase class I/II-fold pyridoxal phosphate-dependent enzyme n=1 Tax=Mucilaginibacter agri TaxID=2695265 RepID=A0A965ZL93_9SPHI|nr:pyridoxal phosphate-dependent aminotransferase family protein [Mucilaginibacter agri]NCD72014.1 aminotransferase class I/II-fold pyridoxal phosphate-dependent enzyme [Mucilaginibacter agri]